MSVGVLLKSKLFTLKIPTRYSGMYVCSRRIESDHFKFGGIDIWGKETSESPKIINY